MVARRWFLVGEPVLDGNITGMEWRMGWNLGTMHGMENKRLGTNLGAGLPSRMVLIEGNAQGVQSLVLSPLISDVFADVFTSLVFATDSPSEGSSECTHFSSDETVCNVSIFGLQCLEENRPFCTCGNCMLVSEEFGANLGRCQLFTV